MTTAIAFSLLLLPQAPRHPRELFMEKMAKAGWRSSREYVREVLGSPDFVLTARDPEPYMHPTQPEVWLYGAESRASFPKLARIVFDDKGEVANDERRFVFRWPHVPEAAIRKSMAVWQKRTQVMGEGAVPEMLATVRMANELRPLGKEMILAGLDEVCQTNPDDAMMLYDFHEGVLQVLFELDSKRAANDPDEPIQSTIKRGPPTSALEGLPFQLTFGRGGSGIPPTASERIPLYKAYGTLRRSEVIPPADPFGWVSRIPQSEGFKSIVQMYGLQQSDPSQLLYWAKANVRDMLRSVAPTKAEERDLSYDLAWEKLRTDLKGELRWDVKRQIYVRTDGSFDDPLIDRKPVLTLWHPTELASEGISFKFVRLSKQTVLARVWRNPVVREWALLGRLELLKPAPTSFAPFSQKGFEVRWPQGQLFNHLDKSTNNQTALLRIPNGTRFRLRLTSGKQSLTSPIFKVHF